MKLSIPIRSFIDETHGIKQSREESNSTSGKNSKAVSESVFKRQMRRPSPRNAREMHHIHIYIYLYLCVYVLKRHTFTILILYLALGMSGRYIIIYMCVYVIQI